MPPISAGQRIAEALNKVSALDGVHAAFVFDKYLSVIARDVPDKFSDEILKRIASQLHQLTKTTWENGLATSEFRLVYDKFAVYCRLFGGQYYLTSFMDKTLEPIDYRQPINLAVIVLEKAVREFEEEAPETELSAFARAAEQSLKAAAVGDTSFAGLAREVAFKYMGSVGRDLVDNGIEDCMLVIPVRAERDMRVLSDYVLPRIPNPLIKRILTKEFNDAMEVVLKLK